MSDESQAMGRRGVLRGGAIAAGVAAGAVIAGASARSANATVGDPVTVGGSFTADNRATSLAVTHSTATPALRLVNTTGPVLQLGTVSALPSGDLAVGNIANTSDGPYIGVSDGSGGSMTTTLATGSDLAALPVPTPFTPERVLDTRTASGRTSIVASSSGAFDSAFRLKNGAWIDVAVGDAAGDSTIEAAFLNVTVTGSLAGGYLTLCPSGTGARPASSTINFGRGQTIANGAFIAAGVVGTAFAVRVYAQATTHVVLDLTGYSLSGIPGPAATAAAALKVRRKAAKLRPSARLARVRARTRP